ncbi:GNAT family N-acetyltransferase [Streptomyces poonensis]|uniref:GNAT family N-acetyltransferase n=1 Tax=Streptomyces poonensis TaxID=68255 RepID=UPI0016757048|nr:GNAT family N-acetyltransferase [Streptomyces poonensis]
MSALWDGLGYRWRNGDGRIVLGAHRAVDALHGTRPTGLVSHTAEGELTIGCRGPAESVGLTLPFLEERREPHAGPAVRRTTGAAALTATPDLLVLACTAAKARRLPSRQALLLPLRLSLQVPVGGGTAPLERVSAKDRGHYRRQRTRRTWTLERATGTADFDFFYDRMHQPTMAHRHGAAARSEPRGSAYSCIFRGGALLFLRDSGTRVAGMLCKWERSGRKLVIRLAGVLDGDTTHYRSGVSMALYIEVLDWAARHGADTVDLGGCEPFLSKGTFQFKRKIHPEVSLPANHWGGQRIWLRARRDSEPLRDFLVSNPPVAVDGRGTLRPVYFHDHDRPPRTGLRWRTPGLAEPRFVDLDQFLAGALPARPDRRREYR